LRPGGSIFLAVYKRTKLTWIHEIIRKTLVKIPKRSWTALSKIMAFFPQPGGLFLQEAGKIEQGRDA
jgi:hypothetical protein